jgi:hypothetical protein
MRSKTRKHLVPVAGIESIFTARVFFGDDRQHARGLAQEVGPRPLG